LSSRVHSFDASKNQNGAAIKKNKVNAIPKILNAAITTQNNDFVINSILKSFIKFLMFAITIHNVQPPFSSITLIAHNYTYDKKVLEKALERHNLHIPIEIQWICTMKLAKEKLVRKNGKATLESCCVEQDILYSNGHRALNDAIMCAKLFKSFFKPTSQDLIIDEALQQINENEEKMKNENV
jgi:DNA polymerase III epsilon subunit-like protein